MYSGSAQRSLLLLLGMALNPLFWFWIDFLEAVLGKLWLGTLCTRNDFVKWTKNTGLSLTNLNKLQIMLGSFEKSDDFKLVNHLLIIAKQTIFYCKQKN